MTLRELIKNNPDSFYANQTWYADEPFMDNPVYYPEPVMPEGVSNIGIPPELIMWHMEDAPPAAVLARLYIDNPTDPIWRRYLWTSDMDSLGQRVYVGDNGIGLEIHRHLHLTDKWAVPCW